MKTKIRKNFLRGHCNLVSLSSLLSFLFALSFSPISALPSLSLFFSLTWKMKTKIRKNFLRVTENRS